MRAKVARRRRRTATAKRTVVEQLLSSDAVAGAPDHVRTWLSRLLREGTRAASHAGTAAGRQEGGSA
jgi:hypothetical protein